MRGYLITLEGIDGCGKSSVALLMKEAFTAKYHGELNQEGLSPREFVFTAEPTSGRVGKLIRLSLAVGESAATDRMEQLFLFMADHAEHLSGVVRPALQSGAVVVSDRYSDSRIAYQGVTLQGLVPDPIDWVRRLHEPWSVRPDLTLLFRLDPALAAERCLARNSGLKGSSIALQMESFEHADFLSEVARNFDIIARAEPDRFLIIDADEPLQAVASRAIAAVEQQLSSVR